MRLSGSKTPWLLAFVLIAFGLLGFGQDRKEVVLWKSIENSQNISDYEGYLDQYPNGTWAAIAKRRIANLRESAAKTNIISVDFDHDHPFKSAAGRGTLSAAPDGVSWLEGANKDHNFQNLACSHVQYEIQTTDVGKHRTWYSLKIRVDGKTYNLSPVADDVNQSETLTKKMFEGLQKNCR